ncbi:MAG: tandem-95 repeat protein, partial [Thermoleophilia bacterium]|nr:tandem-95 repeat protein [Thermoleophilia bacterium]
EDSGVNVVDVCANDSSGLASAPVFTVTAVTQGTNGSVAIADAGARVTYTPGADFFGSDTFTYTITNSQGGTDTADVEVTVTNVNDPPTSADTVASTSEDIPLVFDSAGFPFVDPDTGDSLQGVKITTLPSAGTLRLNRTEVTLDQEIAVADIAAGRLVFQPAVDVYGSPYATFGFMVSDGIAYSTPAHTMTINVSDANDAPTVNTALADQTATEDVAFSYQFAANAFSDVDAGDSIAYSASLESGGALPAWLGFDPDTRIFSGTPARADSGSLTVRVTATDLVGATASDEFLLTVLGVNSPPFFIGALEFFVEENTAYVARLTAWDAEGDPLAYSIVGGPDARLFTLDARTGILRFAPPPDYESPADAGRDNVYDLTVEVSDSVATTTKALIVRVTNVLEVPVSHSPVITSGGGLDTAFLSIPENTIAVTTMTAGDPDPGAVLAFSIAGGPDAGKFHIDPATGALSFLVPPDYERPTDADRDNVYRIMVRVSDGANADVQILTITVTDVPEHTPPPATDRWNDITDAQWESTYGVSAVEVDRVADGGSDGGFHPATPITRAQFAKMAVDGFGLAKATSGPPSFSDVSAGHVFFAWIEGGAEAGILAGLSDGAFAPSRLITRQQADSVLGRYLAAQELTAAGFIQGTQGTYPTLEAWFAAEGAALLVPFADAESFAAVHAPYAAYLVHKGVIQGSTLGNASYLLPLGILTRAQAAAMIVRTGRV